MAQINSIRQAVILAGGQGTRLRPLTERMPKPMVPVNNKPFLEYLIEMLKTQGIDQVVILTGYLANQIEDYFGAGSKFGIDIKYSQTPFQDEAGKEQESGLRLKAAEHLLADDFLLLYCDNYWPLDLKKLFQFHQNQKTLATITVYTNKDGSTKNNILVDENGYVAKYDRSRTDKNLNGVEIGFFIVNKDVLKVIPSGNSHFERDILPLLISKKRLSGYKTEHKYYSVSTPEKVKLTEEFLYPKKVAFLDRDGVINKKAAKADYVKDWQEFKFLPGAVEAMKKLTENGYDIYVVTNQPGIARGMMKEEDLDLIHKNMEEELKKEGVKIKSIYACLHGWNDECSCRKPKPGLLFKAARENHLDLTKAIFIGDGERDIKTGEAAGCRTILVNSQKNLLKIVNQILTT